jgi:FMN phosphatase YigB (HAD superfamily)
MKTILTDCDGVLLFWEEHFHRWMKDRGYSQHTRGIYEMHDMYNISKIESERLVREFNDSAWIAFCPAFRDARSGVAKLVEHGYKFVCITSVGDTEYIHFMRQKNLDDVFGKNVFEKIICMDPKLSKRQELEKYDSGVHWWIEDHPKNALLGAEMGFNTILIDHSYNRDVVHEKINRVTYWKEIAELIITNE